MLVRKHSVLNKVIRNMSELQKLPNTTQTAQQATVSGIKVFNASQDMKISVLLTACSWSNQNQGSV